MIRKMMVLAAGLAAAVAGVAQDNVLLWRAVEEAAGNDLPKTAIEALSKIYDAGVAAGAWDDALAAAGQRAITEGRIEEGAKAYGAILKLDAARKAAPEKVRPLLDALSAEWLSRYYSENTWRFMQRSEVADADEGDDIDSWSLPRILKEVDARFAAVLADPAVLAQHPTSAFTRTFSEGNIEGAYRPTLYDVLAWRAVDFYTSVMTVRFDDDEAGFKVSLDAPLFAGAEAFMAWAGTLPQDSPGAKALRLVAAVMRHHKGRGDALAFADADFNRLMTARNLLQMEYADEGLVTAAYDKALAAFVEAHKGNEVSARAIAEQANLLFLAKDYLAAIAMAEKGMDVSPKSPGANECYAVILKVKAPSLGVETETVWARGQPEARPNGVVNVTCRNIPKLHFRLYPAAATRDLGTYDILASHERMKEILQGKHAYAWEMPIGMNDHQETARPFEIREELKSGVYILVASTREDFLNDRAKNTLAATLVQVSDLAAEIFNVNETCHVRVVNSETGIPVEGAGITCFMGRNTEFNATTDAEGRCAFDSVEKGGRRFSFEIQKGDDRLLCSTSHYYSGEREEDGRRVLLLTARSIYRPGQTVHYKGIYYTAHAKTGTYTIRPDAEWTLRFLDPNGKEINSRKERANRFGAFSGSFVIPADRGTGRMTLQMSDTANSSVSFSVEEYKRPKFEVTFDPLKAEAKLNGNVTASGRAVTYSGLPLEQATVRWSVERNTRYPSWHWRRTSSWQGPPTIATGEAQTDADGTFKISFVAEPEPGAKPEDAPQFTYTIHAEVIDATGETRSGSQQIRLGFSAISVSLNVPEWFTADAPNDVAVSLRTLNGEPVAAEGKAVVYALRQPERPSRAQQQRYRTFGMTGATPDADSPMAWETGQVVATVPFAADASGTAKLPLRLPPGCYRIEATAHDQQGNPVTEKALVTAVDPASKTFPVKIPMAFIPQQAACKAGETFRAVWGSGYAQACGVLEIWADGQLLKRFTSKPDETQMQIAFEVPENLHGGFTVRASMVREGRLWTEGKLIGVPWDNKVLKVEWTHINSKLEPGIKEKWTLTVKDPLGKPAHAEVLASMYDASLDAFGAYGAFGTFWGFRSERLFIRPSFTIGNERLYLISTGPHPDSATPTIYPAWSESLFPAWRARMYRMAAVRGAMPMPMMMAGDEMALGAAPAEMMDAAVPAAAAPARPAAKAMMDMDAAPGFVAAAPHQAPPPGEPPPPVMRKNLDETAFFIPDLVTDEEGNASFTFTAPEALTGWNVMAFAHDAELRSGRAIAKAVTQRKLMIIPNLPRFLREGDTIAIPVKVVNTGDAPQKGAVTLTLLDGRTGKPMEGERPREPLAFDLQPGAAATVSWTLDVPDNAAGILQYALLAQAAAHGDGEEGFLPVLSRRVQVTESMAFSVRGGQEKTLVFQRLLDSAADKTLRHLGVQAELTPNATWNAVLALPYLMEYPHECAEQIFHRYYANALARQIVADNPVIADTFRRWKADGGKALESPLMKNPHLKALAIEETPWLRAADRETEQRHNIAVLFDADRLAREQDAALRKLKAMRTDDGLWPWFSGGHRNDYISLTVMTGLGRLRHIGVKTLDNGLAAECVASTDNWRMSEDARYKAAHDNKPPPLSPTDALYLYGRTFFLDDAPLSGDAKAYAAERAALAKADWTKLPRLSRAQAAIALKRLGDPDTPALIIRSIRENALDTEEQGMCWRDNAPSWWWHELPLESQAMMIEAFLEVAADQASADACALWLLHQKQAQCWPTTLATAQAIYALLLGKPATLAPNAAATLTLGGAEVRPDAPEAGSGYFAKRYPPADVRPELARVHVTNPGDALALGALHWQYLQDIDKLTPSADGTPLRIKRQLFKLEKPGGKRTLRPLGGDALAPGDTLVTRIEVRVDRDMDFVHLKDTRAASLEPDDVLSSYRWQDGTGYFQSTRDTATHFFFDRLPRGTHVFEYDSHVFQSGTCNGGFAEIQCMYAPAFNAHSASETVKSK